MVNSSCWYKDMGPECGLFARGCRFLFEAKPDSEMSGKPAARVWANVGGWVGMTLSFGLRGRAGLPTLARGYDTSANGTPKLHSPAGWPLVQSASAGSFSEPDCPI